MNDTIRQCKDRYLGIKHVNAERTLKNKGCQQIQHKLKQKEGEGEDRDKIECL